MFVKNKTNVDFTYRKGTYAAVLKANSVTFVDENKVTAKELINCYGQRISVISQEETQYTEEVRVLPPVKKEVKGAEEITIDKKQLNDDCIEDLLRQVNEEISKVEGAGTIEDTVGCTETTEDTVEGGADDTINAEGDANTGIEEIDNFLNGKTDKLPEGTEVITEEEAKALEGTETKTETKEDTVEGGTTEGTETKTETKEDTVEGGTTEGTETKTETKKSTRGRRKNK